MKKTMKLVIVEARLDRVALIAPELQHQIEHVIIYGSSRADFEKQIRQYPNRGFKEKIRHVNAWNIFSILDELYTMKDETLRSQPFIVLTIQGLRRSIHERMSLA